MQLTFARNWFSGTSYHLAWQGGPSHSDFGNNAGSESPAEEAQAVYEQGPETVVFALLQLAKLLADKQRQPSDSPAIPCFAAWREAETSFTPRGNHPTR